MYPDREGADSLKSEVRGGEKLPYRRASGGGAGRQEYEQPQSQY
jgi:hypothetical protein